MAVCKCSEDMAIWKTIPFNNISGTCEFIGMLLAVSSECSQFLIFAGFWKERTRWCGWSFLEICSLIQLTGPLEVVHWQNMNRMRFYVQMWIGMIFFFILGLIRYTFNNFQKFKPFKAKFTKIRKITWDSILQSENAMIIHCII